MPIRTSTTLTAANQTLTWSQYSGMGSILSVQPSPSFSNFSFVVESSADGLTWGFVPVSMWERLSDGIGAGVAWASTVSVADNTSHNYSLSMGTAEIMRLRVVTLATGSVVATWTPIFYGPNLPE